LVRKLAGPVAVMLTSFCVATVKWVTVNEPVVAPAAIVIDAGTDAAAAVSLVRMTWSPPVGAGADRVTVPVTVVALPPVTMFGLRTNDEMVGAVTVNVRVFVSPRNPETVAVTVAGTEV